MKFANPVKGTIAGYGKPSPGTQFGVTLYFGCTPLVTAEPRLGDCNHFHRAIDLANGRAFDPVYAGAAGKVRFAGWLTKGGIAILVNHGGGWWTEYGHVINLKVAPGADVKKGQRIADVGSTGATSPHLHFGVKKNVTIPAGASPGVVADQFYNDDNDTNHWTNPWPLLEQNAPTPPPPAKIIRLKPLDESRIRKAATTSADIFAETDLGAGIVRKVDGTDLGPINAPRPYGGRVTGGAWKVPINGTIVIGDEWERIRFTPTGTWRYVAKALAVVT